VVATGPTQSVQRLLHRDYNSGYTAGATYCLERSLLRWGYSSARSIDALAVLLVLDLEGDETALQGHEKVRDAYGLVLAAVDLDDPRSRELGGNSAHDTAD